ncbi:Uncharacterised protein [[Clostridium] sordellii]|nr:Uncharacterised protein [[Clostridium] sordellii] [Paeniclostridium sordellii]
MKLKSPLASFPICILTLLFLSLNCKVVPIISIPPSSDLIFTLLVLISPALILDAFTLTIFASSTNIVFMFKLSPVIPPTCIFSLDKFPFTRVRILPTLASNTCIVAFVACKSVMLALFAFKLVIEASCFTTNLSIVATLVVRLPI